MRIVLVAVCILTHLILILLELQNSELEQLILFSQLMSFFLQALLTLLQIHNAILNAIIVHEIIVLLLAERNAEKERMNNEELNSSERIKIICVYLLLCAFASVKY